MGGAQSQFHDTDWDKGDGGGAVDKFCTFDGAEPTSNHVLLTLTKHNEVNQREFQVRDESGAVLYTSLAVEATTKDFDLCDAQGNKLFHVQTDSLRAKWEIYSYKANFDGQSPAAKGESNLKPDEPLYHKALVKIAWDKYHGEVHLYQKSVEDATGVVSKDPIIKVEEIKSTMAAFQSFVPKLGLTHAPLCGYWVREHTPKTDQFKMHLAGKTDIALHCILVVITNLVHVERQAENCA